VIEHAAGVRVAQGINFTAAASRLAPSGAQESNQRQFAFIAVRGLQLRCWFDGSSEARVIVRTMNKAQQAQPWQPPPGTSHFVR